ncbi:hypothetical protein BC830DRAFT_1076338 [Chytriomyces sp. MP71]|nr:hypothetical protein BC830DRAFT_1076338 [Chytriomyces sp. MP71]
MPPPPTFASSSVLLPLDPIPDSASVGPNATPVLVGAVVGGVLLLAIFGGIFIAVRRRRFKAMDSEASVAPTLKELQPQTRFDSFYSLSSTTPLTKDNTSDQPWPFTADAESDESVNDGPHAPIHRQPTVASFQESPPSSSNNRRLSKTQEIPTSSLDKLTMRLQGRPSELSVGVADVRYVGAADDTEGTPITPKVEIFGFPAAGEENAVGRLKSVKGVISDE